MNTSESKDVEHHVHFDEGIKDGFESDNSIIYQKATSGINVHLGFLQVNHRYRINLNIPEVLLSDFFKEKSTLSLTTDPECIPNLNCKLTDFKEKPTETKARYEAEIEFFAHKEKLLKEELILINNNEPTKKIKFIFTARVLGRGKGTPMLRNGIHCTAIETGDEESDASDWQGFSRTESDE